MLICDVCPSLRQSGYERRVTCIRMGLIQMIMRGTCHHEVRGTCSQEEGSLQLPLGVFFLPVSEMHEMCYRI